MCVHQFIHVSSESFLLFYVFTTNNKIYLKQIIKSVSEMNSVSDQTKEGQQGQQNHWLLSNLLLQGRTEPTSSADGSPVRMRDSNSHPNPAIELQKASPQQKPVNLLPAVPIQTSRKLSDREQRDCDIIGKKLYHIEYYILC